MMYFLKFNLLLFILFIIAQNSYAIGTSFSNTKPNDKPQVPEVNGISRRLIPEKSQTITFPESYFSFGIYRTFLINATKDNYAPSGLGVMFSFNQHIRGIWSGQAEVRWSEWRARENSKLGNTSPLSIFSKVSASLNRSGTFFSNSNFNRIRPYAVSGLGYTFFFDERSLLSARSKTTVGQISATYGAGFKIVLPVSFSVKIGAEQWRGIEDSNYFSNIIYFQLNFGDVDNF